MPLASSNSLPCTKLKSAGSVRILPLTGLAAGAYTVRLDTTYGTVTKRLLVE